MSLLIFFFSFAVAVTNSDGKSPFQRELEGALKERKKRGLVTGFSDSEHSVDGVELDNNNGKVSLGLCALKVDVVHPE